MGDSYLFKMEIKNMINIQIVQTHRTDQTEQLDEFQLVKVGLQPEKEKKVGVQPEEKKGNVISRGPGGLYQCLVSSFFGANGFSPFSISNFSSSTSNATSL